MRLWNSRRVQILLLLLLVAGAAGGLVLAAPWSADAGTSARTATAEMVIDLLGLVLGGGALWLAYMQLLPLLREIEQHTAEQIRLQRAHENFVAPQHPREVIGFDARFSSAEWRALLQGLPSPSNIEMRLERDYDRFYRQLPPLPAEPRGRRWAAPPIVIDGRDIRQGVIIIDLMYVSEFLRDRRIRPLDGIRGLDLETMLRSRTDLHGAEHSEEAQKLMKLLCSNERGETGALPLWINSHGRMIQDPQLFEKEGRIASVSSFDRLLERADAVRVFGEAGIQSYYLIFEFWVHLAYRGCTLFRTDPLPAIGSVPEGTFTSDLLREPTQRTAFAKAAADIATRLRFSDRTREKFLTAEKKDAFRDRDRFLFGHNGDARMIRESLSLWKPVFSSELLAKALPHRDVTPAQRLSDQTSFKPPFAEPHGEEPWTYMSAIGGYGLALPYGANDADSIAALKYVFGANPCLMHPYVSDMVSGEPDKVQGYVERQARPRWPFWGEAEEKVNDLLYSIFVEVKDTPESARLKKTVGGKDVGPTPQDFWNLCKSFVDGAAGEALIRTAFAEIETVATNHQWLFRDWDPGGAPSPGGGGGHLPG